MKTKGRKGYLRRRKRTRFVLFVGGVIWPHIMTNVSVPLCWLEVAIWDNYDNNETNISELKMFNDI
jgi:hypothetical protein